MPDAPVYILQLDGLKLDGFVLAPQRFGLLRVPFGADRLVRRHGAASLLAVVRCYGKSEIHSRARRATATRVATMCAHSGTYRGERDRLPAMHPAFRQLNH